MRREFHVRFCEGAGVRFPFATRLIVGFQYEWEARRFWDEFRERLAAYGLELHPDKTRLIEFGRFAAATRKRNGRGKPERKRLRAKLLEIKNALRLRWHDPVPEVGNWLGSVIRGHINYYAVPQNFSAVEAFCQKVIRHWRRSLSFASRTPTRLNA